MATNFLTNENGKPWKQSITQKMYCGTDTDDCHRDDHTGNIVCSCVAED